MLKSCLNFMSVRIAQPDVNVRRINAKLFQLKKQFHAQTGEAIGSISDMVTAILSEVGNEMLGMQATIDQLEKEIVRLKKFEPKKKPAPEPTQVPPKPEPEPEPEGEAQVAESPSAEPEPEPMPVPVPEKPTTK